MYHSEYTFISIFGHGVKFHILCQLFKKVIMQNL